MTVGNGLGGDEIGSELNKDGEAFRDGRNQGWQKRRWKGAGIKAHQGFERGMFHSGMDVRVV